VLVVIVVVAYVNAYFSGELYINVCSPGEECLKSIDISCIRLTTVFHIVIVTIRFRIIFAAKSYRE
jgi:hypothetical protein